MANELVEPFRELFAKSLDEGALPQCWKEGNITPVFKKGKKYITGNYRPVSLTSVACKMMEQLVRNEVMEHMLTNNLLSNFQHLSMVAHAPLSSLQFLISGPMLLNRVRALTQFTLTSPKRSTRSHTRDY